MTNKTQLAVIGAGPGGYAAAFLAADLGVEVTLIDLEKNPGGVCLYRGCIPSKALLHIAKLIKEAEEATGITFMVPYAELEISAMIPLEELDEPTGQAILAWYAKQ